MTKLQRSIVSTSFILLIVVFFAAYLKDIDYARLSDIRINSAMLCFASLIALGFRYLGVYIWRCILQDLGSKELPSFVLLASIYAKAWMGRYIPGSVTWIAGKIYLASSLGISKSRLAIASMLEAIVQVAAITSVSLLLVGFDTRTDMILMEVKVLLVVLAALLILFLHPKIFNRVIQNLFKWLIRKPINDELKNNKRSVIRSFLLYSVGAFVSGASYFFMTSSIVSELSWHLFFYIVGAYSLAGAIGMAVPLLPSGLGVRDGVQLILLSVIFPKETALILVVFSRLWSSFIDVLFYVLTSACETFSRHRAS